MDGQATASLLRFFKDIADPRGKNIIHKLHDILVIAICAVICGADGWVEVQEFGQSKQSWFKRFLDLPVGIPSHDTFGRVFARLQPDAFEKCFTAWIAAVAGGSGGKLLAIDGKSIRRSFEHGWDKSGMAHLVSAFVSENQMVFSQVAVEGRDNEIAAITRLLNMLDLADATVSIDAIGCQRAIAAQIAERQGRYVLAVKENQPSLHARLKALLDEAILDDFAGMKHGYFEQTDGDHGRIEVRRAWVSDQVQHLGELTQDWPSLASVGVVESQRQVVGGKTSTERRYFISSLSGTDARRFGQSVRGHWSIENQLHWSLDMSFREDERRVRKGHGAENFSRLCRLALNLLKRDKSVKIGLHGKRLKAGWDEHYLLRLLTT
jgi:predicted transposase YbfD/YdcC